MVQGYYSGRAFGIFLCDIKGPWDDVDEYTRGYYRNGYYGCECEVKFLVLSLIRNINGLFLKWRNVKKKVYSKETCFLWLDKPKQGRVSMRKSINLSKDLKVKDQSEL